MKTLLTAALVLAVGSLALSQSPKADPKPSDTRPGTAADWEYAVLVLKIYKDNPDATAHGIQEILNTGKEAGWELLRVEQDIFYIMRRAATAEAAVKPNAAPEPAPGKSPGSN